MNDDKKTAEAFATSWNHLPLGSIYSSQQFDEWMDPITRENVANRTVLELGCGNGSLLVHLARWNPSQITGVDLGASVEAAKKNMRATGYANYSIVQADLTAFLGGGFDLVYCIGVLHHLENPAKGFGAVLANVKPGGRFHCWVYAREGNALIVGVVDPLRRVTSKLPWWITKYLIATPLALPYYAYAKMLTKFRATGWGQRAPLFAYSMWIAQRPFTFFRHVAFDQLVTPRTQYLPRSTIETWLRDSRVLPGSSYLIFRNGNSWKFGGIIR